MKIIQTLPLLLVPLSLVSQEKKTEIEGQNVTSISVQAERIMSDEERKALDYMEDFLGPDKYTGDGKYSYGSVSRFIEGLKRDYATVNKEGQSMTGIRGRAARAYPNTVFKADVEAEIERKGRARVSSFLNDMGVDPKTSEKPDKAKIKNYVTKPVLEEFGKSTRTIKSMLEKDLPEGKKITFPDGISLDIVKHIKSGKTELPEGVKIVDSSIKAP